MSLIQGTIVKTVLLNGLTVLVNPVHNIPKVAMELWYHVGSKDEKASEKGMAHLIEHMIFKGTDKLSESDINMIAHKLSGYLNAFTSHDATAYTYEFPTQHWKEGFMLLSDCMRGARFHEQMLNSELKAVVQELKMYKDRYTNTVVEELISAMFSDHPYHYPIIGFKQDLWNLDRQTLLDFYHKHYVPNNAVLVVVGDVDPEEVFKEAEKAFGKIKSDPTYKREKFYHSKDLMAKSVKVYRDVQHSTALMAASLPGVIAKQEYLYDIVSSLLGAGATSRLTKKLVDELELVTDFQTFVYGMEDGAPFFFIFEPKKEEDIPKIEAIVHEEIASIIKKGISKKELERAKRMVQTSFLSTLEKNRGRASEIGQGYVMTGDENYIFNYLNSNQDNLEEEIKNLLQKYFSPLMMHTGQVLPVPEDQKERWVEMQKISDAEDARILEGRVRDLEIEPPKHLEKVTAKEPTNFHFHRPLKYELSNGLKAFVHNNKDLPKIDLILTLKARGDYDPQDQQGLYSFVCEMMLEGTKHYPGKKFADEIESYGMGLSVQPGSVVLSMLSQDLKKGLELLEELLTKALFDKKAIEKIRTKFLTNLKFFWDDPGSIAGQLLKEEIYKDHPYAKNSYGTVESINAIRQKDLKEFYKSYFSPFEARIAVVGDLHEYDVKNELEKTLGKWSAPEVEDLEYSEVTQVVPKEITHYINRDQVVLSFARPSITRLDDDYDKLLLFEQVFSSGGMASRLFQLRERSGLFYNIAGKIANKADEQPGIFIVQTMVSLNKLEQAEKLIKKEIDTIVESLTEKELQNAKQSVINAQVSNFATNQNVASAFIAIDRFGFSDDYFDTRAKKINAITLDEVKKAAQKYLDSSKMITVKVGRVGK